LPAFGGSANIHFSLLVFNLILSLIRRRRTTGIADAVAAFGSGIFYFYSGVLCLRNTACSSSQPLPATAIFFSPATCGRGRLALPSRWQGLAAF